MTHRLHTLMSRATHYKPMLPSGVGSERWLQLYKPWSFTDVTVHEIVPLGLDESMFITVAATTTGAWRCAWPQRRSKFSLFEAPVAR